MSKRNSYQSRAILAGIAILITFLVALPSAHAGVLTMSPHMFVLNAQGNFPDAQAVIRIVMRSGFTLADYHVTLSFDGTQISEAFDFRYCPIDDNFLASFDRTAILAHPDVIAMANTTVTATVAGWFTCESADGDSYTQEFSCTDLVEVVDPDKK